MLLWGDDYGRCSQSCITLVLYNSGIMVLEYAMVTQEQQYSSGFKLWGWTVTLAYGSGSWGGVDLRDRVRA